MDNSRRISSAPSPHTIIELETRRPATVPSQATSALFENSAQAAYIPSDIPPSRAISTPFELSPQEECMPSDIPHEIASAPSDIPPLLSGIIEQIWPNWTQEEYRKYHDRIEKLGFFADSPTTLIKAIIEDTSEVYKLTSKTPLLLRYFFVRITAKYQ